MCYEVYTLRAHPKIVRVPMVDMEETVVAEKGVWVEREVERVVETVVVVKEKDVTVVAKKEEIVKYEEH